jgi:hypothetical protein
MSFVGGNELAVFLLCKFISTFSQLLSKLFQGEAISTGIHI